MKHFSIHVSGKVQGVFYRASAKTKADELGINGFVQNLGDGRVYVEAEGEADILEQFTAWCADGPPGARVDGVEVQEGALKNFSGFVIKR